ncbi:melanoma-associated antigen C1-like [Capsicum annuum]
MASPLPSHPSSTNSATSGTAIDGDVQTSLHVPAPSSVLQSPSFSPLENVQQLRHSLDSSPYSDTSSKPLRRSNLQHFLIENDGF